MDTGSILSGYGLAGLVITVLAGVAVWQQRRIDSLYKEKDDIQQARFTDAIAARDKYSQVMDGFSDTTKLLYDKLSKNGR